MTSPRARVAAAERQLSLYRNTQSGGGGAGGSAFELRSPLDGVVSYADVMPGAVVEAGTLLVSVVNSSRLWLEAKVYEADVPKVEHSPGASFTVAGFEREFTVDEKTGRRVAVGRWWIRPRARCLFSSSWRTLVASSSPACSPR